MSDYPSDLAAPPITVIEARYDDPRPGRVVGFPIDLELRTNGADLLVSLTSDKVSHLPILRLSPDARAALKEAL